jgi:hypothetical protein
MNASPSFSFCSWPIEGGAEKTQEQTSPRATFQNGSSLSLARLPPAHQIWKQTTTKHGTSMGKERKNRITTVPRCFLFLFGSFTYFLSLWADDQSMGSHLNVIHLCRLVMMTRRSILELRGEMLGSLLTSYHRRQMTSRWVAPKW